MIESDHLKHILTVESPDDRRTFVLEKQQYSIGRHPSNLIVVTGKTVSRHHATIFPISHSKKTGSPYLFWIVDGDLQGNRSVNGIFVNGKRCLSQELNSGDVIGLGGFEVQLKYKIIAHNLGATNEDLDLSDLYLVENLDTEQIVKKRLLTTTQGFNKQDYNNFNDLAQEFLYRLSQSENLPPYPTIDLDLQGQIIFLNSAAQDKFPDLPQLKQEHPILKDLVKDLTQENTEILIREVRFGEESLTQYAYYKPADNLIRSYIFDFSKKQQMEAILRESEDRYRAIVRQMSEGICLVDPDNNQILEANLACYTLLGYAAEEITSLKIEDIFANENHNLKQDLQEIILTRNDLVREYHFRTKEQIMVEVEVNISLVYYSAKEVFCFLIRDITERKRTEKMLRYHAYHDSLTGLPNRKYFLDHLELTINESEINRDNNIFAIVFLGLDRFKDINNVLSHSLGDELLQSFAKRLKTCLRDTDVVARWGSDEFTLLLKPINSVNDVIKIADQIIEDIQRPFKLYRYEIYLKISLGIALYPQDGTDGETILKNADTAMHKMKAKGGNNYQFYNPTLIIKSEKTLILENNLYGALEREEFLLYYQPQVNIITREVMGMEALLRWRNRDLGLVSPAKFIPLAEETGLIEGIGKWALYEACRQNKIWQDLGLPPVKVAVNLSARQFIHNDDLVVLVKNALQENCLESRMLELEITESLVMENFDNCRLILMELQELGICISMDDFGTGYSSLSYLTKIPFNKLKIDQAFVKNLKEDTQDAAIISAIITLGKCLNLKIVAEGIETEKQLELLHYLGCEVMQGYLFSKPLCSEEATNFLAQQKDLLNNILKSFD